MNNLNMCQILDGKCQEKLHKATIIPFYIKKCYTLQSFVFGYFIKVDETVCLLACKLLINICINKNRRG